MKKGYRAILLCAVIVGLAALLLLMAWYILHSNVAVLNPKGIIASQQRTLIITATLLMTIIVVPVFVLTAGIVWKYRASNKKAVYAPTWDRNAVAEGLWWGVPSVLIIILSVIAWTSSHDLDPFRPLSAAKKPLTVQVVALDWKWLFIYPQQGVASVNSMAMPVGQPVTFDITSDAPMNSFWIPQLGGQMYAMPGMSTQLHLQATEPGDYRGSSANISGQGFAGMGFTVQARSQADFDSWIATAKRSPAHLTLSSYNQLARPSKNDAARTYSSVQDGLYGTIVTKYMLPANQARQ